MDSEHTLQDIHASLHLHPDVYYIFKALALEHLLSEPSSYHSPVSEAVFIRLSISFLNRFGASLWPPAREERLHLTKTSRAHQASYWSSKTWTRGPVYTVDSRTEETAPRAPSAKSLYIQHNRRRCMEYHLEKNRADIYRLLTDEWNKRSTEQNAKWQAMALETQAAYGADTVALFGSETKVSTMPGSNLEVVMRQYFQALARCPWMVLKGTSEDFLRTILLHRGEADGGSAVQRDEGPSQVITLEDGGDGDDSQAGPIQTVAVPQIIVIDVGEEEEEVGAAAIHCSGVAAALLGTEQLLKATRGLGGLPLMTPASIERMLNAGVAMSGVDDQASRLSEEGTVIAWA